MSEPADFLGGLKAAAHDVLREVAERADLAGMKEALQAVEAAGRKDRVDATITSAVPLTEAERSQLEARLVARYGREMPVEFKVDPGILGGLVVQVGDRLVDASVAARLGQLRGSVTGTR